MSSIEYVKADTIVHRLNPVSKLAYLFFTLALVFITTTTESIIFLFVWLIGELILWKLGKVSAKKFSMILKAMVGISIFVFIIQAIMYRGATPILVIGHLKIPGGADLGVITLEGVFFGSMIVVRIITAVLAIPIFTMTTKPIDLMESLAKLRIPFVYSFMLVTAMRFTPMVQNTWDQIVNAQKLRKFDIDKMNIFSKVIKAYVPMLVPLLLILLRDANQLQIAIESRAFGSSKVRTPIAQSNFQLRDLLFLTVTIGLFTSLLIGNLFYTHFIWDLLLSSLKLLFSFLPFSTS